MASKVFIDANVLLDFTLKRENYSAAKQLFSFTIERRIVAYITPSILHIVGYWLTKAYGKSKTKVLLLQLLTDVQVIEIPHEIVLNALHSRIDDIKDALQYYTALHHRLHYFITEDKNLKKSAIASLPFYTVQEFLRILQ